MSREQGIAPIVDDDPAAHAVALTENIRVSGDGIQVNGSPDIEEWGLALNNAAILGNMALWAIGDLIVYGESREWGEMYTQYIELTQRSYFTLANAVRVSRDFPPGEYRKFTSVLSWSHHRETLPLQDINARMAALQEADTLKWSRDDLRDHVKILRAPKGELPEAPSPPKDKPDILCPSCGYIWKD